MHTENREWISKGNISALMIGQTLWPSPLTDRFVPQRLWASCLCSCHSWVCLVEFLPNPVSSEAKKKRKKEKIFHRGTSFQWPSSALPALWNLNEIQKLWSTASAMLFLLASARRTVTSCFVFFCLSFLSSSSTFENTIEEDVSGFCDAATDWKYQLDRKIVEL